MRYLFFVLMRIFCDIVDMNNHFVKKLKAFRDFFYVYIVDFQILEEIEQRILTVFKNSNFNDFIKFKF